LRLGLVLLLGLRLVLGLLAVAAVHLAPRASTVHGNWEDLVITGGEPWSEFLSTWQRWDALWYQHITQNGYAAGDGSTAFFPLYPLLSHLVSLPLGGQIVWAELLVSSASFVLAMWLLFRIAQRETGVTAVAYLAVLLTALFPVGFFLLAPYTEGLFLALTLAAFWFARTDRPWAAGAAGFLAALTRAQGIFLALPIAFEYLRTHDVLPWIMRRGGNRPGLALFAAGLPMAGTAAVTLYERLVVGEQRSAFEVLALWGYQVVPPWEALSASWNHILAGGAHGNLAEIEAVNLVSLLGFGGIAVAAARRLPIAYALYTLPSLALLFTRIAFISPLASASRYVLVLFPCFILLALWLSTHRWMAIGWLSVSAISLLLLLQFWTRWGFVG
jgi:hypothetical protein